MKKFILLLNSRSFATWLLLVMVAALIASTFLPNEITLSAEEWLVLSQKKPIYFAIAETLSTPYLVKNPFFLIATLFLFLSTLVCTITRLKVWWTLGKSEFSAEKAFSFAIDTSSAKAPSDVATEIEAHLSSCGWEHERSGEGKLILAGQRGIKLGFWGSIVFHLGMIACFIAIPVSALTGFSGSLILTEGAAVPLRQGTVLSGGDSDHLPDVLVGVNNTHAKYAKGRFKVQFGGDLVVNGLNSKEILPFSVNNPVSFGGYQFSLQEFGFSPHLVIAREGNLLFDYNLNLRHPTEGDYFPVDASSQVYILFFPDFFREGQKIASLSDEPRNPRFLVKIIEGGRPIHEVLIGIGEEARVGEFIIKSPDLRHWVNLAVSRDLGLPILIFGIVVGIVGLLLRFISNERRLEFDISLAEEGASILLRGYSRYYPAFLEKEVRELAAKVKEGIL